MQLFKSQFLQEPDRQAHDFAFGQPAFAPRYGRRVMSRGVISTGVISRPSFALSTAMLHGDEEIAGEDRDAHLARAPLPYAA